MNMIQVVHQELSPDRKANDAVVVQNKSRCLCSLNLSLVVMRFLEVLIFNVYWNLK